MLQGFDVILDVWSTSIWIRRWYGVSTTAMITVINRKNNRWFRARHAEADSSGYQCQPLIGSCHLKACAITFLTILKKIYHKFIQAFYILIITDWVRPSGLKDPTTNTLVWAPSGNWQYCAPARPQYKDNRGSNIKYMMLDAILLLLWHCVLDWLRVSIEMVTSL